MDNDDVTDFRFYLSMISNDRLTSWSNFVPPKEKPKPVFGLSDIKAGMRLTIQKFKTKKYIVMDLDGELVAHANDTFGHFIQLKHYNQDFTRSDDLAKKGYNITAVWDCIEKSNLSPQNHIKNMLNTDVRGQLLFVVKEPIKVTMHEIMTKYGIDLAEILKPGNLEILYGEKVEYVGG